MASAARASRYEVVENRAGLAVRAWLFYCYRCSRMSSASLVIRDTQTGDLHYVTAQEATRTIRSAKWQRRGAGWVCPDCAAKVGR